VKTLYLAKEPGRGVRSDLSKLSGEITIVDCLNAYGDYYRKKGYNCISKTQFFDLNGMKFDVIVGNPPYGSGGNLAIKFLNKCGDLSDDVRLVLPLSVRKVSSVNKIRLDMICVGDDQLPDETFPGGIRTVLQRWVKTDTLRDKIETITTHPDFDFVKKGDPNTNVFVMRSGHAGKVLTEGYEDYEHSHYFIHAKKTEVIETLKQCETKFREVAKMTNGMDKLSKHELVTLYMECIGE